MKLDLEKFPTIKNLADDVRQKALEYASSLGARGPRPTTVLGTAITLAKEWKSGRLPTRPVSSPFLVQPRQGRWIIKRSTEADATHTFSKKDDAVRRAQELAKAAGAACFVFGPGGTLIERYEAKALAHLALVPPLAEVTPEPIAAAVALPEAVVMPAPVAIALPERALEPVAPVEVVAALEAVLAPVEVVAALEPEVVTPALVTPEAIAGSLEPIRVQKLGNKWAVILGEGESETLPTQKKAAARAKVLANKLGRPVA